MSFLRLDQVLILAINRRPIDRFLPEETTCLELTLDPLQPEAMVKAVDTNKQLQLGAVE